MGLGALLRTKAAKAWFGDMLQQSPRLMTINGAGIVITSALILLNLIFPTHVTLIFVKLALVGIAIPQLSTLFMQVRGHAPRAAMVGPIVLILLVIAYWFLRT